MQKERDREKKKNERESVRVREGKKESEERETTGINVSFGNTVRHCTKGRKSRNRFLVSVAVVFFTMNTAFSSAQARFKGFADEHNTQ